MNVGIVGSHRVGKTTLATEASKALDIKLVLTSSSEVFKRKGIDPSQAMSFRERLAIQIDILQAAEEVWGNETEMFITDRTPVDFLMYTYAEVSARNPLTETDEMALKFYAESCIDACNEHFGLLVQLQPGIKIDLDTDKAIGYISEAYFDHLNYLATGILSDRRLHMARDMLPRAITNLSNRVNYMKGSIVTYMEADLRMGRAAKEAGNLN